MTYTTEIKKAKNEDKLVIGYKKTLKELGKGNIAKVFLSNNAPDFMKSKFNKIKKSSKNFTYFILTIDNTELGTLCKKPFSVSCLGIKSDTKNKA